MYKYVAGYTDKFNKCWEIDFEAKNLKEALKDARSHQKEYGKLWTCHRDWKKN